VLAKAQTVGRGWSLAEDLAKVFKPTRCPGDPELERGVFGRELCLGQKRGLCVGKTKRGKGSKWMVVVDGSGIPLGSQITSASPAEVKLAESTLDRINVPRSGRGRPKRKPQRVVADRAYDSSKLRLSLARRNIELVCPHRGNRKSPSMQDGRALRRYRKRWKVERTFAWLQNFRRLLVRQDRLISVYQGFFHLACALISLRYL